MSIFDEYVADTICNRCDLDYDQNLNIKFHKRARHYGRMTYLCDNCFNEYKLCRLKPTEMYKYRQ